MTQTQHDANAVLMGGGGAPSHKFDQPGSTVTGRIVAIGQPYQEREYDPNNPGGGAPKFYPKSGDPIMSFTVDVLTTARDASIEDDDGTRRIYMDGKRIKDAVRTAIRASGAPGLDVGGTLTIQYTHDDVQGDHRSGKNYAVTYAAPPAAANGVLMGEQPQAPQQAPAPAYQPPAAPQGYAPPQAPAPVQQPVAPAPPVQAAPTPDAAQLAAFQAWQASQAAPQQQAG